LGLHVRQYVFQRLALFTEIPLDGLLDLLGWSNGKLYVLAQDEGEFPDKLRIERVKYGHAHGIAVQGNGHRAVHARHAGGHGAQHRLAEIDIIKVEVLQI